MANIFAVYKEYTDSSAEHESYTEPCEDTLYDSYDKALDAAKRLYLAHKKHCKRKHPGLCSFPMLEVEMGTETWTYFVKDLSTFDPYDNVWKDME